MGLNKEISSLERIFFKDLDLEIVTSQHGGIRKSNNQPLTHGTRENEIIQKYNDSNKEQFKIQKQTLDQNAFFVSSNTDWCLVMSVKPSTSNKRSTIDQYM